jgi:HEAT repeat protein
MDQEIDMGNKKILLDDRAMRQFITDGYIQVRADFPPSLHRDIYRQIEALLAKEANPGNNILPKIPALRQIFGHPAVRGALHSILGPGCIMHPHRYCHLNPPAGKGQTWHKDDYVFDHNVRHHRFRWVMAFYYPQDVREDMGPTGILPGTQFRNEISSDDPAQTTEEALPLCGEAGTVTIVNFDTWHRATANTSDKKRYMLKFQFIRMQEPRVPTWNQENPTWQPVERDKNPALSKTVWDWLSGSAASAAHKGEPAASGNGSVAQLTAALRSPSETSRLDAAYALGALGEPVVPALVEALRQESGAHNLDTSAANVQGGNPADLASAHALAAVGAPAVPALLETLSDPSGWIRAAAVDILGNIGPPAGTAVAALAQALQDEEVWVRRNAAEALGLMGTHAADAVPALREALRDSAEWVRLNAALALAKIGPPADPAVAALVETLDDENRYTQFFAATALQEIATPEAQTALQDALFAARWCPATTAESPY